MASSSPNTPASTASPERHPPSPGTQRNMHHMLQRLEGCRRIVVILGAGASVSAARRDSPGTNAGLHTFRQVGSDPSSTSTMMDGAVAYASTDAYRQTQRFLLDFYDRATGASPTITHRWLGQLAQSGRLLRLYTTNIDDLESQVPSLQVPQLTTQKRGQGADRELWTVNNNDAGPHTIQLHGRVTHMRCRRCGVLAATRPSLFREPPSPNGSRLDPVMYNDPDGHPLGSSIGRAMDRDAASMPDALLIIGSSLPSQIQALQNMAARMAGLIPDDKVIAWINPVAPPNIAIGQGRPCFFGIPLAADDVACSASAVSMPGPSPPPQTPFVSLTARPVVHPDIKSKERNAIIARYASVEIRSAEDVKANPHHRPSNPIPAVKGLQVQGGFACRCGLLTTSWKWLRVHFNKEHPTWNVNSHKQQWSLVRVQTFFTGPKRAIHYFYMTTTSDDTNTAAATPGIEAAPGTGGQGGPPGGVEDDELVARIKERWACGQDRQEEIQKVLANGAAKHEITNWLRRSGWTAHFVGRDLGEIYASSRMPGPGKEEARQLIAATDRLFFNRCMAGLRSMPLMTRLLLASPHPKDAHSRPFRPLQEKTSMDREGLRGGGAPGVSRLLDAASGRGSIQQPTVALHRRAWDRQRVGTAAPSAPLHVRAGGTCSIVAEIITNAEDILWGELMFKEGHDVQFTIPLDTIEDDLTYTHRGKLFIYTNGLEGKEVEMLEDLTWGSGIARGDEIGGLRLVNGVNRDRSVFVINGDVVLVTQYHKSLAHFDSPKVIPRIVPPRVGQLLAMYIVYIRSLTDRWEADHWAFHGQMKPPSDFIWHNKNGPWEGAKISKAMAKWTHYYIGVRLTL
ncbi:hypothetical protein CC79DRAFT_1353329 [Sarocladium strictum]